MSQWSSQGIDSQPVYSMPSFRKQTRAAGKIQTWFLGQRAALARRAAMGAPRRKRYLARPTRTLGSDPTVHKLNCGPSPTIRLQRTIPATLTYGTNWVAGVVPAAAFVFDPSGLYGNTSAAGTGLALTDWTALSGIFDQYRVEGIACTFEYKGSPASAGTAEYQGLKQLIRYNYDANLTTPAVLDVTQLSNVVQKDFTESSPSYTYNFKPKVLSQQFGGAAVSSQARNVVDMGWTDMGYPAQLWGIQTCPALAAAGLFPGCTLDFSITYDISFKYSK